MNRLPLELLTKIFDFAADHDPGELATQIIPLTHVCRHWRTVLLSYPKIWSTVRMKPGNPSVISEWLARSQNASITVIAEFSDSYEHPPCRYQDSATATLAGHNNPRVCPRHEAVLSLDRLLPHRSRIRDLSILLHSSDPDWEDHDGEPVLLYHQFFRESLPNLQHLDFRAIHVELDKYTICIPDSLFAKNLPRLEELTYLGVTDGLTWTAKNLTSGEIGSWRESAGPSIIPLDELQAFLSNNKTIKSLTINDCEFFQGHQVPTATPLVDLKFLKASSPLDNDFKKILDCIHAPQFKNLDTAQLSFDSLDSHVVATDSSGHTFEFSQLTSALSFHPLQHLGVNITTLRLDGRRPDDEGGSYEFLQSLDTVQVLEFGGGIVDWVQRILSVPGILPGLKVIRVTVIRYSCERVLRVLADASRQRMEGGDAFTAIELLLPGVEGGLDRDLRAEWEKCYKTQGIQNFLSR